MDKKLRKLIKELKKADGDRQYEILEQLEDEYHVDLTHFYGEDFEDRKTLIDFYKKLKITMKEIFKILASHLS